MTKNDPKILQEMITSYTGMYSVFIHYNTYFPL